MKRNLVLIVSLVAGLIAALLTRTYLTIKENEIKAERQKLLDRYGTMEVLCLYKDTPSGTVITKADLATKNVPAMGMRGQALTIENLADVVGRKTVVGHKAKEVLFWSDIEGGDPNAKGLSADVKKQMRAISINVTGAAAVSCMVKPNDHVDVIGTFNFPDDQGKIRRGDPVTSTILQNVLVLATGKETGKSRVLDEGGRFAGYSTVTLEVTPREAEMLAFAEQMKGRLVLTLRNRTDTSAEKELLQVNYEQIRQEIDDLNQKRQLKMGAR
jgi:pilus assembly protein CpaB